jgi:hypothetical protein
VTFATSIVTNRVSDDGCVGVRFIVHANSRDESGTDSPRNAHFRDGRCAWRSFLAKLRERALFVGSFVRSLVRLFVPPRVLAKRQGQKF